MRFWTHPLSILYYFTLYLSVSSSSLIHGLWARKGIISIMLSGCLLTYTILDESSIQYLEKWALWYGWWVSLGIASSIGLGTGLHTFLLFLGPFIAETTLTAYGCGTLAFDTHGPDAFECPGQGHDSPIDIWRIAWKVRPESFFWGLGTAIGELPPYFVARAAALAGRNDPSYISIETILSKPESDRNFGDKANVIMHYIVQRLGFFGIMLCASIPNPLFDLAGIICGHFGVPFYTFFGAVFVGKSLIKSSLQSLMVIILFSEDVLKRILDKVQTYAPKLHSFIVPFLQQHSQTFGTGSSEEAKTKTSFISLVWNFFLIGMVLYFLVSIIESLAMAQRHTMLSKENSSSPRKSRSRSRSPVRKALQHKETDSSPRKRYTTRSQSRTRSIGQRTEVSASSINEKKVA